MLESVLLTWTSNRLEVWLPVAKRCDLMEKVTDAQMADFKTRLANLKARLVDADLEADTYEACNILRKELGEDFVVPSKPTTTQKVGSSLSTTGRSA
jgi:hypothetical protein